MVLKPFWRRRLTPVVVLAITLGATALIAFYVYESSARRDQARFQSLVISMQEEIRGRITVLETVLAATKGFIRADSPPLTLTEFEEFCEQLDVPDNYPGIQGIGYTARIRRSDVPAFEAFARSQGLPGFKVWPDNGKPYVHSILYLEPQDKRNIAAIGFDMSSNSVRREAMDRAARTGEPALTGPVTLVQEIEGPKQAGFLLYMPIYAGAPTNETQRLEQLLGYSYIPVRADDFAEALVGRKQILSIGLRIYDGAEPNPESLLHADPELARAGPPLFQERRAIEVAGRTWTVEFSSRPEFDQATGRGLSVAVAATGVVVSLILFALAFMLNRAWLRAAEQSEDLRESEATLATRERQLDTLLSNTPDIIARFDRNLRHLYVNAAVEPVSGLKPEQFIGKTNVELGIAPGSAEKWVAGLRRVFESGEPLTTEFSYQSPHRRYMFETRLVPERGPDGSIESVLAVTRDITAIKQAETRLRASARYAKLLADASRAFVEARLDEHAMAEGAVQALVAQLADVAAILKYEPDGDRIVNLAMRHRDPEIERLLFESPVGKAFPRSSTKVIASVIEAGAPVFVDDLQSTARLPEIATPYLELIRRINLRSLMVLPLKAEGRSLGVLVIGSQSKLNAEDMETCIELANRAALTLENARLFQESERAVRLRDEFLSIASHELKTPLTPLQLQMESLERLVQLKQPIGAERLESIARITVRQVQRLTALVGNLLDISRISSGRLALEPEPADLGAIVDETVERFAAEGERVGSPITVTKRGALEGVWDRLRIEQVVTNLLSNALKYGAGKPVEIYVTRQDGSVELRVVDHGIGLEPEFIPKMFDRFARGVSGRSYGGLGLGLFIVHEIVHSHGGTVEARPSEGATELRVVLPCAPRAA